MNKMRKKRRYFTLMEIMIVMVLIGIIAGAIAYNYSGGLEEGKAFKTKAGIEKLETILSLRVAEDPSALDDMEIRWVEYIQQSPLVQNPRSIVKDGWGQEYKVTVEGNQIKVSSEKYETYKRTHKTMFGDEE